jgi:hypothetical protein
MASTYTTRIGLEKQGDGENANTWGLKLNSNVIDLVDEAVAGYETIDLSSGAISLTDTDGVPNQARNFGLKFTGALTADTTVTIPAKEKIYYIFNDTTENYTIYIKPAGGTAVSVVEAGRSMIAATDGSNINLLESVDPNIYATKVEVQAVSATMATSINNSNVARASLSATMATSINNSNVARAALSATVATSINNSNIAIAANTSSIAVVSSTMATSISNTNSRIAATSLALATSISNSNTAITTVSATLESRIATVSSTMATSISNTNSRITATSLALATSISNSNSAITTVSATLESRIATVSANLANGSFVVAAATSVIYPFPSGTRMLFQQTTAPVGWTKVTTHNNKALRLVNGTVGSGGTQPFTTAFSNKSVTGSVAGTVAGHTLTLSQMPSHRHFTINGVTTTSYPVPTASNSVTFKSNGSFSGPNYTLTGDASEPTIGRTNAQGGGGSHNHGWSGTFTGTAIDMTVQYVDVIIASKD